MLKGTLGEPLVWFVYAAIAVTGVCALVYMSVQQNYRQTLNDPQIQMAEDGAAKLAAGDVPASLVDRNVQLVDIDKSLAPWIAVYDAQGMPLEASGQFNNQPPQPPKGLFDASRVNETRVTWQPQPDVRQAIVLVHVGDKFVVAGRNMREVENRVAQLSVNVVLAWLFTLGCLFVASFIGWWLLKPRK